MASGLLAQGVSSRIIPTSETVQFSPTTYTPSEEAGTVTLTVTRAGTATTALQLSYVVNDGTAVAATDYTDTSGTLNWAAEEIGDKTFAITILDRDGEEQGNLVFTAVLTKDSGDDTLSNATATVTIQDQDGAAHPLSRNLNGVTMVGGIDNVFDPENAWYLLSQCAQFALVQMNGMFDNQRAGRVAEWRTVHDVNPFFFMALHDNPFKGTPGFRVKPSNITNSLYDYLQTVDRTSALTYTNSLSPNPKYAGGTKASNTAVPTKQAQFLYNLVDTGVNDFFARRGADAIAGPALTGDLVSQVANMSSYNQNGGDLSDFAGWFNDGTGPDFPNTTNSLLPRQFTGQINSGGIISSQGSAPSEICIVELDADLGLALEANDLVKPTASSVAVPAGMKELTDIRNVWFTPAGNTKKFIAMHALGAYVVSNKTRLYMKPLSTIANNTQSYTPVAGDNYCVNGLSSGGTNIDWQADGTQGTKYDTDFGIAWDTARTARGDYISTATGGARAAYGGGTNTSSISQEQRSNGWTKIHTFFEIQDYPQCETFSNVWFVRAEEDTHDYEMSRLTADKATDRLKEGMVSLYMQHSGVRTGQTGWIRDKSKGLYPECLISSSATSDAASYEQTNDLDHSYALWNWAVYKTVPDVNFEATIDNSFTRNNSMLLEEGFLDLNTNWSQPDPLGTYNAEGNVAAGSPVLVDGVSQILAHGEWTWAPHGQDLGNLVDEVNNRRIYIRRFGNYLVAMNCATPPENYDHYMPAHITPDSNSIKSGAAAGATYANRTANNEDRITQTEIDALRAGNGGSMLSDTAELWHLDFDNYNNAIALAALKAVPKAAEEWTASFTAYGPRQPHPRDKNNRPGANVSTEFDLATTGAILRDDGRNTGLEAVFPYDQGPLEATVWEIREP